MDMLVAGGPEQIGAIRDHVMPQIRPDLFRLTCEIARNLPEAHFIHVIRDGRDVALSKRNLFWFGPGVSIEALARAWIDWIIHARAAAKSCSHYMEIRFEDLIRSPRDVL